MKGVAVVCWFCVRRKNEMFGRVCVLSFTLKKEEVYVLLAACMIPGTPCHKIVFFVAISTFHVLE